MPRLSLTVLAAALSLAGCGAARAEPPIWVVKGKAGEVVLFGSIHLLPAGLAWRTEALDASIANAREIWFELPIDQTAGRETSRLIVRRGRLPAGDTLSAHLPAADQVRLRRVALLLGAREQDFEIMRPWLAEISLSVLADVRAGATASDGVERAIQDLAPRAAVRRAFETPRRQIDILAGMSPAEQVQSFEQTLAEIEDHPQLYDQIVSEWVAGDVAGLERDALDEVRNSSPAAYRRLFSDRNARWRKVIKRLASHRGLTVVVVGVGHLIGPDGVPELLRHDGMSVSGP